MSETKRYFFSKDDDGHSYMIPVELRQEWLELREDDEAWAKPEWDKFEDCRIDSYTHYSFENPKEL
jgi:hypothetical protein